DLRQRLDPVLQLPVGKVPNRLLSGYFSHFGGGPGTVDSSILVGPGIGEDSAIVDIGEGPLLAIKSDPITFASADAIRDALLVNANDIATCGAQPRWYMCTLLFPEGTAECEVDEAFRVLSARAAEMGISLCGGHTEITDAVSRLVVSGTLLGQVSRNDLVRKRGMREGDAIVLTKAAGLEGTAIFATGFEDELVLAGLSVSELAEAASFRNEMSIVAEARIARTDSTAMHDVTEGGIATALAEFAAAGGHSLRVDLERIPLRAATRRICEALGVDPLGLIGSGALLITCAGAAVPGLVRRLADSGIRAEVIGEVGKPVTSGGPTAVEARRGVDIVPMPTFEVDELARLFARRQESRSMAPSTLP
ncbi:MAG TPA: AIR synthase family protein, partial [Spirochaetia bacterium]|nr:AIR synthase family protein [Spirochaetia bacterium]